MNKTKKVQEKKNVWDWLVKKADKKVTEHECGCGGNGCGEEDKKEACACC